MKPTRLVLLALALSLAACGTEITGPESSPPPAKPALSGIPTLGSGS